MHIILDIPYNNAERQRYPGTTAVCHVCGEVYVKAKGHNCPGPRTR